MKRILATVSSFLVALSLLMVPYSSAAAEESGINVWEPCEFTKIIPCIISVEAIAADGKVTTANTDATMFRTYEDGFATQVLHGKKYEWITPGIKHENGNEHTILKLFYFPLGASYCWAKDQCTKNADNIVFDYGGGWWDTPQKYTDFPDLVDDRVCGDSNNPSYCTPGWGLNPDYSYRVKAKLPAGFKFGYSVGFGKRGSISVDKNAAGQEIMTITVTPAQKSFRWRKYYDVSPTNYQQKADTTNNIVQFFVHGVTSENAAWLSSCEYGKGMSIWTNGDIIQNPTWNSVDRTIQLQLASMEYRANGDRNEGTFEVAVPIKIAQCLWGVDLSKSVSAMISATYSELGKTEIIATSSRIENGTYFLSANGFHYSTPTLKVKLTQEPGKDLDKVISEPNQAPQVSTAAKANVIAAKKTITCTKGKTTKKVTGLTPKCPAGYKKK